MFFRFLFNNRNDIIFVLMALASYQFGHMIGFKSGYAESGYDMIHANKIINECHTIILQGKIKWKN